MTGVELEGRYTRQGDLIPAERLENLTVTVVGVGAIGRQVALQLAAIGVPRLQLVDFDHVEVENLAPQGYFESDLGELKVDATAELIERINSTTEVERLVQRFKRSVKPGEVLFNCVDSITTRESIWRIVRDEVQLYIDTRMSAEVVRVLVASDPQSRKHYPTTLFSAGEAHAGACTAKSTIYTANIAAGLAVGQFTKWLRGFAPDEDVMLNVLTCEMSYGLEEVPA